MVIVASGMARGRVRLATTTTLPKMAAILQKKLGLGSKVFDIDHPLFVKSFFFFPFFLCNTTLLTTLTLHYLQSYNYLQYNKDITYNTYIILLT